MQAEPISVKSADEIGQVLLDEGKEAEAIQVFHHKVELHSTFTKSNDSLGRAYEATKHEEAAIDSCRKALQFDKKMPSLKLPCLASALPSAELWLSFQGRHSSNWLLSQYRLKGPTTK